METGSAEEIALPVLFLDSSYSVLVPDKTYTMSNKRRRVRRKKDIFLLTFISKYDIHSI